MVFALFEPDSELTALFYLVAVVVWGWPRSRAPRWVDARAVRSG